MLYAAGVVGHIDRKDMAYEVCRNVDGQVVSLDDGSMGCEANHHAVLTYLADQANLVELDGPTWLVALEDDAQPVPDFPHHLDRALAASPSPVVGLYLGTGNPSGSVQRALITAITSARATDRAWLQADWFVSAVGYAVKRELVDDLLDFCRDRTEEWPLRVTRWAQDRVIDVSYTFPSLVNHADVQSVISPTRFNRQPRRAHSWGVAGKWKTRVVRIIGDCPPWSVPDAG